MPNMGGQLQTAIPTPTFSIVGAQDRIFEFITSKSQISQPSCYFCHIPASAFDLNEVSVKAVFSPVDMKSLMRSQGINNISNEAVEIWRFYYPHDILRVLVQMGENERQKACSAMGWAMPEPHVIWLAREHTYPDPSGESWRCC